MSGGLISEDAVRIESCMSRLYEAQGPVDLGLFVLELVLAQGDVEPARVKECLDPEVISVKVIRSRWLQSLCSYWGCGVCRSHRGLRFQCGRYILGCLCVPHAR